MKNVDEVVGKPIVAGSLVTAKGRAKAILGGAAVGAVAGSAAKVSTEMAGERTGAGVSPLPGTAFTLAYLAVTADEVVLVEGKQGMLGPKAQRVVATAPRQAVTGGELGSGTLARPLVLRFADDVTWELEVPRANVKQAERVLQELQAA